MLVRTVSRNADGTPRDRATIAVSPDLTSDDIAAAERLAEDLDARGYLPPDPPMGRAEHARIVTARGVTAETAAILWAVLGQGVPLGTAIEHAHAGRSARRRIQRLIRDIGWGERDDEAS